MIQRKISTISELQGVYALVKELDWTLSFLQNFTTLECKNQLKRTRVNLDILVDNCSVLGVYY